MSCVKGSPKTGGRKKGTLNKNTGESKEVVHHIVSGNAHLVQKKLDMLVDPKDWLHYYIKLLEFDLPKKAAVSVDAEIRPSDLRSEILEMEKSEG